MIMVAFSASRSHTKSFVEPARLFEADYKESVSLRSRKGARFEDKGLKREHTWL